MGTLFQCIKSNHKQEIVKLWKKDKNLFKKKGPLSSTILHVAALFANDEVLQVSHYCEIFFFIKLINFFFKKVFT